MRDGIAQQAETRVLHSVVNAEVSDITWISQIVLSLPPTGFTGNLCS